MLWQQVMRSSDENPDQEIADTQRRADEQMYQDKMKIKRSTRKSGILWRMVTDVKT